MSVHLRVFGRLVVLASLVVLPGTASAQSVNAGSIAGTVRDTSGAVLPGVTVEASSPALIEKSRTSVTDTQGTYKIVDLRPGVYTVTFTLAGFSTVRREALELTTGFTANVTAEMKVGTIEETVTVSGASPVVDIQNVRQQIVLSREVWEALPTGKTIQSYASLTPGALMTASSQDVGGSKGDTAGPGSFTFHGTGTSDSQVVIEGMNFQAQTTGSGPWTRTTHENQFAFQETTLASSLSAEIENAGVFLNHVPRDGGNTFAGTFGLNGASSSFQGRNITPELVARGVQAPGSLVKLYDVGGGFGGPIKRDKVWFFFSDRTWNAENYIVNSFYNATPAPAYGLIPIYTQDLSHQAISGAPHHDDDLRLTVQVTGAQKVNFFSELQGACTCAYGVGVTRAPEAGEDLSSPYLTHNFAQGTWTWIKNSHLLFEAGDTLYWATGGSGGTIRPAGVSSSAIPVYNISTGYYWNAFGQDPNAFGGTCCSPFTAYNGVQSYSRVNDSRFSVTLGGASQTLKIGARFQQSYTLSGNGTYNVTPYGAVALGFLGGTNGVVPVPAQIYELLNPQGPAPGQPNNGQGLVILSALYAQDQWVVRRLTMNLGLRFDGMYGRYNALTTIANDYVGPQTIPGVTGSPSWKDINPRVGVAIDLFGNGKTAVKGSVGRYVTHASDPLNNPAGQLGFASATYNGPAGGGGIRTWNDTNHNYAPDCNLANPLANGECGPLPNTSRGLYQSTPLTTYDPAYLDGWDVRPYYWNSSLGLQHELRPGMGLNVTYFNTWQSNLSVTANRATPPSAYSPYCVTAPTDPRLGSVSGQQLCGLYDLNPAYFGQVNNLVTLGSNYGTLKNIYNGVDATLNARFGRGGTLQGGVSTSRLDVNNCVVTDTPQTARPGYCSYTIPWSAQTQLKLFGAYPLAWGLQVSGTFQNLPGPQDTASHTYTNAQVAPSLGRNLSSGANGTVTIALLAPYTVFEPRFNQVDLRLTKAVPLGRLRALIAIDGYNLFNGSAVLATNGTYSGTTGGAWLTPSSILGARLMKLGVQLDWK